MGEVVVLPIVRVERHDGNGAREAVIRYAEKCLDVPAEKAAHFADHMLIWLWAEGYKLDFVPPEPEKGA